MDMAYIQFIRAFVELKPRFPFWDRILKYTLIGRGVTLLVVLAIYYIDFNEPLSDQIMASSFVFEYLFIFLPFAIFLIRTRVKANYYLIAGMIVLIITVFVNALFIGLGRPDIYLMFSHIGIGTEVTLFTFGLGYRLLRLRKKQEEAKRVKAMGELKDEFFTNITHEFRTPLTIIQGTVDYLGTAISSPNKNEKIEALGDISHNNEKLLYLVNQILDLSKASAGYIQLEKKRGDIISFLRYITESFETLASFKGVIVQFNSSLESFELDYDEFRIQQVIANLPTNAVKFTPEKGSVNVFADISKKEPETLIIKVKDTGIGIPEDKLPHIFERFYQVGDTRSGFKAGTGVGLALVKELLKLMNGQIEVQSIAGKGTIFTIMLPVEQAAEERHLKNNHQKISAPDIAKEPETNIDQQEVLTLTEEEKPILLIVEDSKGVIKYLNRFLRDQYQIEMAFDGQKGVEKAFEIIPDIIITDIMMPEKDGIELCEELTNDSRTSHIPKVVLTAKTGREDKIRAYKAGANSHLTKPFDKEELDSIFSNMLKLRANIQAHYKDQALDQDALPEKGDIESEFLSQIKHTIEENIAEEGFGINELADKLFMSRVQLYRKLKALIGRTPSEYLTAYRMTRAKSLIEKTDMSIGDVAFSVGYGDPSHFTKVFQRVHGVKPSEVRK